MDYNTEREHLVIREYGRHVQNLIGYAKSIKDKEERQKVVDGIILLMGQLSPHLKNVPDFTHKLWDHLFMIGGFDMDIDSPYDRPSPEITLPSPASLPYPKQKIRFKHYGKNIETMIAAARQFDDLEKKKGLTEVIVNFMKMAYKNWSDEEVSDDLIRQDLETLSEGTLFIDNNMNIEAFLKSSNSVAPSTNFSNKSKYGQNRNNNKGKSKSPNNNKKRFR